MQQWCTKVVGFFDCKDELISAKDQNKELEKESDEAYKSTDSTRQDECKHDEKAQIGPSKPVLCDDHFKDIISWLLLMIMENLWNAKTSTWFLPYMVNFKRHYITVHQSVKKHIENALQCNTGGTERKYNEEIP